MKLFLTAISLLFITSNAFASFGNYDFINTNYHFLQPTEEKAFCSDEGDVLCDDFEILLALLIENGISFENLQKFISEMSDVSKTLTNERSTFLFDKLIVDSNEVPTPTSFVILFSGLMAVGILTRRV